VKIATTEHKRKDVSMIKISRRKFIALAMQVMAVSSIVPGMTWASDPCAVKNPLMPPDKSYSGQCPNCGMARPMWARTWKTFDKFEGATEACSFHCLADMALKAGQDPKNVKVSLFLDYARMIPAEEAFFVVGSSAAGTMTMTSKAAFADQASAQVFAATCGGKVVGYGPTMTMAKAAVIKEHRMLVKRRLKKGKIVEPTMSAVCPVCGMKPAKYPQNKSQIQSKDGQVAHFCSTHCLFSYLGNPAKFTKTNVKPFLIWVMGMDNNLWISSRTAYYVMGSGVSGPMGPEALPFNALANAKAFASKHGGKAVIFDGVSYAKIMAK
jgi:copper chaperone NosL